MTAEPIDALFFSFYADVDRWHNDWPAGVRTMPRRARAAGQLDQTMMGRIERQSVHVDGRTLDLPRFLSWARYGDTSQYRRWDAYTPTHLSGAYYESLLGAEGLDVRHVNYADRLVIDALKARYAPRHVLFSTSFMIEMPTIMDALRRIRLAWPDARVVVGGFMLGEIERDVEPDRFQEFLRAWGADAYVVSAMGEEPLRGILRAPAADLRELDLPGTWVRNGRGYVPPGDRQERGLSMDDTWVRWTTLDPATLYHTVHMRTARSCKFKCSFCSLFQIEGDLAMATPETLRRELEELSRVEHVRSIIFTDDTFNVPQKRFHQLCEVLREFDFDWYSFYRCQFADEATVALMRESGCKAVFLGLESVDDDVLKIMNKASTVKSYRRGLEQLKRNEIAVHANFIVGFPGDVAESAQRIVEFVDEQDLEFFSVSPWFCAPSTSITWDREKYGIEGNYYDWKHDTMTSAEAIELEQWMIRQPKRAGYMSQLSADTFWSEIMFYCNGFSVDEARTAARVFNGFAGRRVTAAEVLASPEFAALKRVLARREMAPPAGLEVLEGEAEGAPAG